MTFLFSCQKHGFPYVSRAVLQFSNFFKTENDIPGQQWRKLLFWFFFKNIKCALKKRPFSWKKHKMSQNVQKKLPKFGVEFFRVRRPNSERKWAYFKKTNRYISVFWKKFVFSTCRQPMRLKPSFALFFHGKKTGFIFWILVNFYGYTVRPSESSPY